MIDDRSNEALAVGRVAPPRMMETPIFVQARVLKKKHERRENETGPPPQGGGITSTTLTLFGPPKNGISSRFSRGKSGYRKKGGFFRH